MKTPPFLHISFETQEKIDVNNGVLAFRERVCTKSRKERFFYGFFPQQFSRSHWLRTNVTFHKKFTTELYFV